MLFLNHFEKAVVNILDFERNIWNTYFDFNFIFLVYTLLKIVFVSEFII